MKSILETVLMVVVGFTVVSWAMIGLSYVVGQTASAWIIVLSIMLYFFYGTATHKRFLYRFRKEISLFFMLSTKAD